MHAALGKLVARWMAAHPFAERLPDWLTPPHRPLEDLPADPAAAAAIAASRADIDAHVNTARDGTRTTFRQRRAVGEQLAGYLERHDLLSQEHALKLRACRHGGAWGLEAEGGRLVIAWDAKCSLTLLCPHCARTEQRRLVRRYKEPMKRWKQQRAPRRIHSGVFTWPNVTPGDLAGKLRLIFKWFRSVSRAFPSIKGYVATVEAPLAARGDWNLHLNVLLCVEGPLHWGDLRAAWHRKTVHLFPAYEGTSFQVELRQLPRYDDDALDEALRELIKYAAKHVTEKGNGKSGSSSSSRGDIESLADGGTTLGGGGSGDAGQARGGSAESILVRPDRAGGPGAPGRGADRGNPVDDDRAADVDAEVGAHAGHASVYCLGSGDVDGGPRQQNAGATGGAQGEDDPGVSGGAGGARLAPAMIDWPPARFAEWWEAHRRYRRTRSYGCLFGEDLEELAGDIEDPPRGEVTWYGRIWWDGRSQGYAVSAPAPVGLIQANNSTPGTGPPAGNSAQSLSTGPPRREVKYRNRQLAPGG